MPFTAPKPARRFCPSSATPCISCCPVRQQTDWQLKLTCGDVAFVGRQLLQWRLEVPFAILWCWSTHYGLSYDSRKGHVHTSCDVSPMFQGYMVIDHKFFVRSQSAGRRCVWWFAPLIQYLQIKVWTILEMGEGKVYPSTALRLFRADSNSQMQCQWVGGTFNIFSETDCVSYFVLMDVSSFDKVPTP